MILGRRTNLFALRKRLKIPTVRRAKATTTLQERTQAVLDLKVNDITGQWGVAQVRQRAANAGFLLSRSVQLDRCTVQ